MEIIQLPGYTEFEKLNIAEQYLVPKQREANGLEDVDDRRSPRTRSATIIHHYTKEAGVRNLEREIATRLPQGRARTWLADGKRDGTTFEVTAEERRRVPRRRRSTATARREEEDEIGLVQRPRRHRCTAATCWRPRSRSSPGKGKLVITGKLGEVHAGVARRRR